ncbi:type II secretion system F family protein [Pasteurella testudinis]|uniref:type II secretion system F family protein n=1 Tax=Pasteurella testudinis TaxID=761 RepID=UPI0040595EB5
MNLYYLILLFGLLLVLFTLINWIKVKKTVATKEYHTASFFSRWLDSVSVKVKKWLFYFSFGKPKNIPIHSVVLFFMFFISMLLNDKFLKANTYLFLISIVLLFIFAVWFLGNKRSKKIFENTFPEVIQVIVSATSSGAGLLQALERCGQNIHGPLGSEFQTIYRRLAIGEEASSVFADSYTRYPYKEYYYFIMIIKLNLARGGQIREVISRLGKVITDSKKMEQRKKSMTSEARMSAMIVACIPLSFFIFMRFFMTENFDFVINDPSGRIVLYYVLGSESLGLFIVWWLMRKST